MTALSIAAFSALLACAPCHRHVPGIQTAGGLGSGPDGLYRGTMMANAGRDPYWKGKMLLEGEAAKGICRNCHLPGGVGCTLCHGILPDGLGTRASFNAGFALSKTPAAFGPHGDPVASFMRENTGHEPRRGMHILDSALCGTCHTVVTGDFVQQAPYLEWLAAGFPAEMSCQSCHVPVWVDNFGQPVARHIASRPEGGAFPGTSARTPFGRHHFAGGNTVVPEFLAEADPSEAAHLRAASSRARRMVEEAVMLDLETRRVGNRLEARVKVINLAGHKVPTGFPSRRVWLHVAVMDAKQRVVFESGGYDSETGLLTTDRGGPQPHHGVIDSPAKVQVYESEMADSGGNRTISLLDARRYWKDNRLLPHGFNARAKLPDGIRPEKIAPVGVGRDPDFVAGSDTVVYRASVPAVGGPFVVRVHACYQAIKPSHLRGLETLADPDVRGFLRWINRRNEPLIAAAAEAVIR